MTKFDSSEKNSASKPAAPWIAHWAGSNPYKGWSIRQGRDEVIWFGETISSETVEGIVLAHNKCFDCEGSGCVMNCSGLSPAAPAQSAEPVGWAWKPRGGSLDFSDAQDRPSDVDLQHAKAVGGEFIPLYAAPKPSPTAVVLDDERAAFEVWYLHDLPREVTGLLNRSNQHPDMYDDDSVEDAWTGWQARTASPQPVAQASDWRLPGIAEFIANQKDIDAESAAVVDEMLSEFPIAQPVEQTRALTDDARDAARYRWLREFDIRCKDGVNINPPCEHVHASMYSHAVGTIPAVRLVAGEELDRVIDAAMTAARPASVSEGK